MSGRCGRGGQSGQAIGLSGLVLGGAGLVRDEDLIPRHGGYRRLKSFQVAQLAYDVTVRFCDRFVSKWSRTRDQMVQAARSGVQNIAEGSKASGTSKKTELKLTNVARASLEELRLDYEDFLRQQNFKKWERSDPHRAALIARRCASADEVADWVKQQVDEGRGHDLRVAKAGLFPGIKSSDNSTRLRQSTPSTKSTPSTMSMQSTQSTDSAREPEIMANAVLVLIAVACSLLDRQLTAQARAFEREGGFTERMYRVRTEKRNKRMN